MWLPINSFQNIIQLINQTYDYNILLYYLQFYSVLAELPISKSFIFPNDETWIFLKSKIPKKKKGMNDRHHCLHGHQHHHIIATLYVFIVLNSFYFS